MTLLIRIENLLFCRSVLKGKKIISSYDQYKIVLRVFEVYKDFKKGGVERNMLAAVIKKIRPKFPYQIIGWAESEDLYKDYFKLKNCINFKDLKVGDYITRFRTDYPVKGEKLFEYYTNSSWSAREEIPETYKISSHHKFKKHESFHIEGHHCSDHYVNEENITSYLYATKEEIKEYEKEKRRRGRIQNKIDTLRKNIRNLEGEL